LWWACDIADQFKPISEEEIKILKEKSKKIKSITVKLKDG
jgi:hypothetical protein